MLFNRRLWTFFLDSVTRDDNPLPIDIRQNVASLGVFVINRSLRLTSNPQPDGLGTLHGEGLRLQTTHGRGKSVEQTHDFISTIVASPTGAD